MKKKLKTSNFEKIFLGGNILWKLNEMNFSEIKNYALEDILQNLNSFKC